LPLNVFLCLSSAISTFCTSASVKYKTGGREGTYGIERSVEPVAGIVVLVYELVRVASHVRERLARSCVNFSNVVIHERLYHTRQSADAR
jgi:hypothetical protein